jgi:ornithine cyclodeaminase/alanine dehydrogenase-like protein (mu-crystallin family)
MRGDRDLEKDVSDLGEVLAGERPGRLNDEEIITFLSPGIGFCDIAVARWMYDLAVQHNAGDVAYLTPRRGHQPMD